MSAPDYGILNMIRFLGTSLAPGSAIQGHNGYLFGGMVRKRLKHRRRARRARRGHR